jgi:hypothetical protein
MEEKANKTNRRQDLPRQDKPRHDKLAMHERKELFQKIEGKTSR